MKVLAIETSCDETAASVVARKTNQNYAEALSNIVASSLSLHSKTGGIVPEIAAREQVKYIISVIDNAFKTANLTPNNIDAIAVTVGPGLIGSLLVGVETAKTLSYVLEKPIIPVNHLFGHIYANWLTTNDQRLMTINFPSIGLIVSGGHTDLVLIKNHSSVKWLGGTRDDAAGEAFDKIGRLLGLPYPAGPIIETLAKKGNPRAFNFPRPMIGSKDFDFSFSGLKTAVWRETKTIKQFNNLTISNICASFQQAVVDVLVRKTLKAAKKYNVKSILLGGGVAANQKLRDEFIHNTRYSIPNTAIFAPQKSLCTDNAAMIGAAALFNYSPKHWSKISANPELYFDRSYKI